MTVRQINAVYFHDRDENGKVLPKMDGPAFDALTLHDAAVVRVMDSKGVSQEAAERLVFEEHEVLRLRARLNAQQRCDIVTERGKPDRVEHLEGPTDAEIDQQAEELRRRLIAER